MPRSLFDRYLPTALTTCLMVMLAAPTLAAVPYSNPGPFVVPAPGPGIPKPVSVPGKEFSHFADRDMFGAADFEQVIGWDGNPANPGGGAGVMDGFDYSGSRPGFGGGRDQDREIDALANSLDALFRSVRADTSALLFSVDSRTSPAGAPIPTSGGNLIGEAGDISFERIGAPAQGIWALGPVDIDSMTPPRDVDGLEVWGGEPDPNLGGFDANRYSHDLDAVTGVSVWAYDFSSHASTPYVPHSDIVTAVISLLGFPEGEIDVDDIDLDALMVQDVGAANEFDEGDSIIFSINQLIDPVIGVYATGSEIFTLDVTAAGKLAGFLKHGGHVWDPTYALSDMRVAGSDRLLDINALEAVSVPEPATAAMAAFSLFGLAAFRRRRQTQA